MKKSIWLCLAAALVAWGTAVLPGLLNAACSSRGVMFSEQLITGIFIILMLLFIAAMGRYGDHGKQSPATAPKSRSTFASTHGRFNKLPVNAFSGKKPGITPGIIH